ncbi:MAG TPA: hypothetical protein DCZ04_13650 [Syntrophorhabdus aromaticivorans]|nr:hypothetical protein [Syntrophorhabdus aromaticivorans]
MIDRLFKKTLRWTIIISDLQQETKQDENSPGRNTRFFMHSRSIRERGADLRVSQGSQQALLAALGDGNRLKGKPLRKGVLSVPEQEFAYTHIREIPPWHSV